MIRFLLYLLTSRISVVVFLCHMLWHFEKANWIVSELELDWSLSAPIRVRQDMRCSTAISMIEALLSLILVCMWKWNGLPSSLRQNCSSGVARIWGAGARGHKTTCKLFVAYQKWHEMILWINVRRSNLHKVAVRLCAALKWTEKWNCWQPKGGTCPGAP